MPTRRDASADRGTLVDSLQWCRVMVQARAVRITGRPNLLQRRVRKCGLAVTGAAVAVINRRSNTRVVFCTGVERGGYGSGGRSSGRGRRQQSGQCPQRGWKDVGDSAQYWQKGFTPPDEELFRVAADRIRP